MTNASFMSDFNDAFFDLDTIAELADYASDLGLPAESVGEGALTSPPTDGVVSAAPIPIIFDNEFMAFEGMGEMGAGTSIPRAWCKTADALVVKRGDTLTRAGVSYNVIEARPDGFGMTMLILSRN